MIPARPIWRQVLKDEKDGTHIFEKIIQELIVKFNTSRGIK